MPYPLTQEYGLTYSHFSHQLSGDFLQIIIAGSQQSLLSVHLKS